MNNAVWWELACKRVRRDAARLLRWVGAKLLLRALFALIAFGFVALGWINADQLREILAALSIF